MHKLSRCDGPEWSEHIHRAQYALPAADSDPPCLRAGIPRGDPAIFERLVTSLTPPYFVLYVLHTPRGEGEPGRYQSPELAPAEFREFIARFAPYLAGDSRFDVWAHSPGEDATVVWDRHDELFAYGPIDRYVRELQALGFVPGTVDVPVPHVHHYREELDAPAAEILGALPWHRTPLQPADEQ